MSVRVFGMKIAFELVDSIKWFALPNVGRRVQPIEGLN